MMKGYQNLRAYETGCRWRFHPAQAKISWRYRNKQAKNRMSPSVEDMTTDSKLE